MMLKLQQYQFTVSYKKGKGLYVADTLSSTATNNPTSTGTQEHWVFRLELAGMDLNPYLVTNNTLQWIQGESTKDPLLAALHTMVMTDWPPERKEVPEELSVFWSFRDEISAHDGIFLKITSSYCSGFPAIWDVKKDT